MNLQIDSMKYASGTAQGAAEGQIFTSEGLWCFSQSFSALSIRVCQPYPVDLNASITSGECLIVMRVLGLSAAGRPRRDLMTFARGTNFMSASSRSMQLGSVVAALRIFLSSSSVGKIVPGLSFGIFVHLLSGGEAQADNSAACEIVGFGKTDRKYSVTKIGDTVSQTDISRLSVITSIVFVHDHVIPVQIFSFSEGVAMFTLVAFAFLRVKSDVHLFIACTLIGKSNVDSLGSGRYSALAAAKSVAGLRIPESNVAHNRVSGFFVRNALARLSMVAQAGAPSGAPASTLTGNANSVWATTNRGFASAGGGESAINVEAATMATVPTPAHPEITLTNGRAVTSSLAVTAYFSKRHDNIIQKIQALECSQEFIALNFKASNYTDSTGRQLPCYEITRSGFMFLVMGFTGKKAAHLKENYINAFDAMEAQLAGRFTSSSLRSQLLLTVENGVVVDSHPVRSDEYTCSMATFFEIAERQGYLVIHADDLKSLTFGNRKRGDS